MPWNFNRALHLPSLMISSQVETSPFTCRLHQDIDCASHLWLVTVASLCFIFIGFIELLIWLMNTWMNTIQRVIILLSSPLIRFQWRVNTTTPTVNRWQTKWQMWSPHERGLLHMFANPPPKKESPIKRQFETRKVKSNTIQRSLKLLDCIWAELLSTSASSVLLLQFYGIIIKSWTNDGAPPCMLIRKSRALMNYWEGWREMMLLCEWLIILTTSLLEEVLSCICSSGLSSFNLRSLHTSPHPAFEWSRMKNSESRHERIINTAARTCIHANTLHYYEDVSKIQPFGFSSLLSSRVVRPAWNSSSAAVSWWLPTFSLAGSYLSRIGFFIIHLFLSNCFTYVIYWKADKSKGSSAPPCY